MEKINVFMSIQPIKGMPAGPSSTRLTTSSLQDPVDLATSEPGVLYNNVGCRVEGLTWLIFQYEKKIYFALSNDFLLT